MTSGVVVLVFVKVKVCTATSPSVTLPKVRLAGVTVRAGGDAAAGLETVAAPMTAKTPTSRAEQPRTRVTAEEIIRGFIRTPFPSRTARPAS